VYSDRIDKIETFVLDSRVEGFNVPQPLYRLFVKLGVLSFACQVIQRHLKCIGNLLGGIDGRNSFARLYLLIIARDNLYRRTKLVCDELLGSLKFTEIIRYNKM